MGLIFWQAEPEIYSKYHLR
uniref:Uncharacterized protein n=1 Tax=Arundo donax TaxID=35708 RepID=A0A0A8ZK36_ARUDO